MEDSNKYQVLARKYRPQNFDDLIGQEAMVRILSNAFSSGRVAHAFIMTGVRGIGKTTTARIIAKGLNCIGADGKNNEPTINPCGVCPQCQSISEGRNIDVLELDAASNTQVDKMREILAGVPYRPSETRYKVYIFDEVHMLSNSAFNAVLKTLEEPPAHVKFIFATTDIQKVPVTVLSRCQRFDLRRIEPDQMHQFLKKISESENCALTDDAVSLIARAAEGSARDALSLLDRAIVMGDGETTAEHVRQMLGLADYARMIDLFDSVMKGDVTSALSNLRSLYQDGADAAEILSELAEITHWVSLLKVADDLENETQGPEQTARAKDLATRLELPVLARTWQMLLKLIKEIELAPNRLMGAEMAIIRLCHVANQPPPSDLLAKLNATSTVATTTTKKVNDISKSGRRPTEMRLQANDPSNVAHSFSEFPKFDNVISLIREHRDMSLLIDVENYVRVANYKPGSIEISLKQGSPASLPQALSQKLKNWTGTPWLISVMSESSEPTLAETKEKNHIENTQAAETSEIFQKFRKVFPKAKILDVHFPATTQEETDDDWDPFDLEDEGY